MYKIITALIGLLNTFAVEAHSIGYYVHSSFLAAFSNKISYVDERPRDLFDDFLISKLFYAKYYKGILKPKEIYGIAKDFSHNLLRADEFFDVSKFSFNPLPSDKNYKLAVGLSFEDKYKVDMQYQFYNIRYKIDNISRAAGYYSTNKNYIVRQQCKQRIKADAISLNFSYNFNYKKFKPYIAYGIGLSNIEAGNTHLQNKMRNVNETHYESDGYKYIFPENLQYLAKLSRYEKKISTEEKKKKKKEEFQHKHEVPAIGLNKWNFLQQLALGIDYSLNDRIEFNFFNLTFIDLGDIKVVKNTPIPLTSVAKFTIINIGTGITLKF